VAQKRKLPMKVSVAKVSAALSSNYG
jgi:hypothetical protein